MAHKIIPYSSEPKGKVVKCNTFRHKLHNRRVRVSMQEDDNSIQIETSMLNSERNIVHHEVRYSYEVAIAIALSVLTLDKQARERKAGK